MWQRIWAYFAHEINNVTPLFQSWNQSLQPSILLLIRNYAPPPSSGPIPRTMVDFWRLVWQERPSTIVMVTNLKEDNKKKCEQYWPDSGSSTFGPFKVTLTKQQDFADSCIRTMKVSEREVAPYR